MESGSNRLYGALIENEYGLVVAVESRPQAKHILYVEKAE